MKKFKPLVRLAHITHIVLRFQLDELIFKQARFHRWRFLLKLNPYRWKKSQPQDSEPVRLREAFVALGPLFIKLGQLCSTRLDILPAPFAHELARLQDRVPAFDSKEAIMTIEEALAAPITTAFKTFEPIPLASASIAQVYGAVLHDGTAVVVKVLRPNIKEHIDKDIALMRLTAAIIEKLWGRKTSLNLGEMIQAFETTLHNETNLLQEGANASQLRRNTQPTDGIYIPTIYWTYCRENVLVLERVDGIPLTDRTALKKSGVSLKKIAERCLSIFIIQSFRDRFFHADMHPGNIFINTSNLQEPELILVDFGITGTLTAEDEYYLSENFIAVFNHDYLRVADLHVQAGWTPGNTSREAFAAAIRLACEPILSRPLKEVSFSDILIQLTDAAHEFKLELQPQILLFQKTIFHAESLVRALDPEMDLWKIALPLLEKMKRQQHSPKQLLKRVFKLLPRLTHYLEAWVDDVSR